MISYLLLGAGCQAPEPKTRGKTEEFTRVSYNRPIGTAYLGVGLWAWPLAMDYDGVLDLLVNSLNGSLFENIS